MKLFWLGILVSMSVCTALAQDFDDEDTTSPKFSMDQFNFKSRHPLIILNGGIADISRTGIGATIEQDMSFGAKFLMGRDRKIGTSKIFKTNESGVAIDYLVAPGADSTGLTGPLTYSASIWNFALSNSEGYGYKLGDGTSSVTFFTGGNSLGWSSVTVKQELNNDSVQTQLLRDFSSGIKFGEMSRAAIDFRLAEPISIRAGLDWQQIYVKHMFWYWGVSQIISGIADGAATWFVNEIGRSSPTLKPIMHFILRNGVAMGFKALRKDQMNWPFTTAAPLNVITYNVGIGIHF